MVDWDLVKLQYEVFHEPIAALAEENQVSPKMIEIAISEKGWRRAPIKRINEIQNLDDIDQFTDEILEQMRERSEITSLIKSAALNPKYVALEAMILKKAMEITQAIIASAPNASDSLQKVAGILEKLNGGGSRKDSKVDGEDGTGGITVQVLNKIEATQPPQIQVSASPAIESP